MSQKTSIEWTDVTWNPVRGCSRVSEGCRNCYAEVMAARFSDPGMWGHGFAKRTKTGGRWTGKVELVPDKLAEPLSPRKPRKCFVNSASDLFHERLSFEDIAAVYGVMAATPHITYQVLTKRPERRRKFFDWLHNADGSPAHHILCCLEGLFPDTRGAAQLWERLLRKDAENDRPWPLPNVWEGTSVENQETADNRIPELLQTPAAVRFVSYEPGLGPVDFSRYLPRTPKVTCPPEMLPYYNVHCALSWIIVGGESGPGARPFNIEWARSAVRQFREAGVACFVKQDSGPKPGMQGRIPDELWVKEFPHA